MPTYARDWIVALCVMIVLAGCAAPAPPPPGVPDAIAHVQAWPQAPAEARVRYVRSISTPQEWGVTKSVFRRVFDALAGKGEESFVRPTGVAEQHGVLYIADPGAPALWILDSGENRYVKVERAGDAMLQSPVAVAVRPDGSVFVSDTGLKQVLLFDRNGDLIRVFAETQLARPSGVAYDPGGERLYIVDSMRHVVSVYDANGSLVATIGRRGSADAEFNFPTHVAVDAGGTLLVTDALNFRVQEFGRDGRLLLKFGHVGDGGGDFAAPKGVGSDSAGNIYVVDALFDTVQIFDRNGIFLLGFGEHGTGPGQFWLPGGVYITPADRIYIADAYNRRVQVFSVGTDARAGAAR